MDVLNIHKKVIDPHELQGLAGDKSLDAIIHRVENRIHYGLIGDAYDLAATYAVVIAVGHVFNDANKRTAVIAMDTVLRRNGICIGFDVETTGQIIVKAAQGIVDETQLARHLRSLSQQPETE
ncbi:MAG: type II toxin-antitoxin system death-on-curing family toxin [Acidiferrobacterales bacterium]|nr:type II toxin-antitoxin system death-on-curing family toxin [Acidiferrobacterales bacterium]